MLDPKNTKALFVPSHGLKSVWKNETNSYRKTRLLMVQSAKISSTVVKINEILLGW